MEILQSADLGTVLVIAIGCVLLCVVGLVLFFGLQIIGTTITTFAGVMELFSGVISGGPAAWCGCLVFLFLCVGLVGGAFLYVTCSTSPNSMNFCLLFP
jgi:hypothetical protein